MACRGASRRPCGTDPRWYRYSSTFGCEPRLVADLTRAYADGFQSPDGNVYDFAFGLNWNGAIADRRTERYR
ncbi:MAG: hypothetical protein ACI4AN_07480 [Muribaculaceae bacterium]